MKPISCVILESHVYRGKLVVIEGGDQLLCILCCCARWANNHSKAFKDQCNGLATAVAATYGDRYAESVTYLRSLARNEFGLRLKFLDYLGMKCMEENLVLPSPSTSYIQLC